MQKNDERLGTAPLGKLMVSMAVPAVAAQLINMLYNIVDRIYIGHIEGYGDLALTGVGVTFPILMLISAFSGFAGMGGAPLASIQLGRKNYDEILILNIALFSETKISPKNRQLKSLTVISCGGTIGYSALYEFNICLGLTDVKR